MLVPVVKTMTVQSMRVFIVEFCCANLKFNIVDLNGAIIYLPQTRSYIINMDNTQISIMYCPWCGSKLPSDLTDELMYIIYDKLKLTGYYDPRLPPEFTSDEWWSNTKKAEVVYAQAALSQTTIQRPLLESRLARIYTLHNTRKKPTS